MYMVQVPSPKKLNGRTRLNRTRAIRALMVALIVGLALPAEKIAVVVGHVRALARAARDLQRQRGEMRAFDVVVEVRGGEDQATVRRLHHRVSIIATVTAMTLQQGQHTQRAFLRSRSLPARSASESLWPHGKRISLPPEGDGGG